MNVGKPELSVHVDRMKAADLGVKVSDAAEALRLLVGGDQVTTYNEGGEQYEVHVRAAQDARDTAAAIGQLTVPSDKVGSVPLDNLARMSPGTSPSEINRLNRQRQVTIYAGLLPGVSQTGPMDLMTRTADSLNMGPGYSTRFAGRSRELGRAAQNFLIAFGLSLVFMYLILAAQFESWLHPVTILLSLPLTLPFALLSIIITGQSLNIFSALGLLVLFGVVKKNSILQIDHANQLRDRGMERDAAILQASRDRLRPILMTTFAFVAGMIPAGAVERRRLGHQPRHRLRHHRRPVAGAAADAGRDAGRLLAVRRGVERAAVALAPRRARRRRRPRRRCSRCCCCRRRRARSRSRRTLPRRAGGGRRRDAEADARRSGADGDGEQSRSGGRALRAGRQRCARLGGARGVPADRSRRGLQRNSAATPPANLFSGEAGIQTDYWSGRRRR